MPAVFGVSSFFMIRVRWDSTVLALIPRSLATSFVVLPSATSCSTSRSRGVSGSAGSADFARYACTRVRETRELRYTMPDRNLVDRSDQIRGRLGLDDEPLDTRPERFEDVVVHPCASSGGS